MMSLRARRRGSLLGTALAIATVAVGCRSATTGSTASPPIEPQAVTERDGQAAINAVLRRDIEAVNTAMTAAFNRGDYLAAARFYTDDAKIIGPGTRVSGRAAVDRYWTSIPAGATWTLEVLEVGGSHQSPWQLGRSTLVVPSRDPGGPASTSVVDFIAVWRRQPDRSLRLYADMYVPAPRPPAPR